MSQDFNNEPFYLEYTSGIKSLDKFNYTEAQSHFESSLIELKKLNSSPELEEQELEIQLRLGQTLAKFLDYSHQHVQKAFTRAEKLGLKLGKIEPLFQAYRSLWASYLVKGATSEFYQIAKILLELAETDKNLFFLTEANLAMGTSLSNTGKMKDSCQYLRKTIVHYDKLEDAQKYFSMENPKILAQGCLSVALFFLGYLEKAIKESSQNLLYARSLKNPYHLAFALTFHGLNYSRSGVWPEAESCWGETVQVCEEYQIVRWLGAGLIFQGHTMVYQNRHEAGIYKMKTGLSYLENLHQDLGAPLFYEFLAEGFLKTGEQIEGKILIEKALEISLEQQNIAYLPDAYRLKGEVLSFHKRDWKEAENHFQNALEIANNYQLKMVEFRIILSYCKLLDKQEKFFEAYNKLKEIYEWFKEGLHTYHFQEARKLLKYFKNKLS